MNNILFSFITDKKFVLTFILVIIVVILILLGYIEINITFGRPLDNFIPVSDYEFKGL